jgi:2'-5' RNA ligase
MRTFIAIEIPEAVKDGMARAQDRLKSAGVDASWSRSEGIHLTLKFLGETRDERVPQILQALALEVGGTERFRLTPEGVGTFPNPAAARVVWLGVKGDADKLVALQAAVDQAMIGLGGEPDGRPYTPHLTLGRIKRIRERDAWLKGLEGVKGLNLPGFDVTAISLISSELRPTGAVYRELGRVALR